MTPILVSTIAGLATALGWGTSDYLAAKSTRKLKPVEVNFAYQAVGMVLMLALWTVSNVEVPSPRQLFIIGGAALLIEAAFLLMVKALSIGAVGIIVPLANSYPIVTVLLSVLVLGEVFKGGQTVALVAIIGGAMVLAYEKNHKKVPFKEFHKSTILAACASIAFGLDFFVLNEVVDELSWQALSIYGEIFTLLIASVLLVIADGSKSLVSAKRALSHKPVVLGGMAGMVGAVTFYVGSDAANSTTIPAVLSAGGPLIASLWGAWLDKESIGVFKRVGAVLVVAGIVILNLS